MTYIELREALAVASANEDKIPQGANQQRQSDLLQKQNALKEIQSSYESLLGTVFTRNACFAQCYNKDNSNYALVVCVAVDNTNEKYYLANATGETNLKDLSIKEENVLKDFSKEYVTLYTKIQEYNKEYDNELVAKP